MRRDCDLNTADSKAAYRETGVPCLPRQNPAQFRPSAPGRTWPSTSFGYGPNEGGRRRPLPWRRACIARSSRMSSGKYATSLSTTSSGWQRCSAWRPTNFSRRRSPDGQKLARVCGGAPPRTKARNSPMPPRRGRPSSDSQCRGAGPGWGGASARQPCPSKHASPEAPGALFAPQRSRVRATEPLELRRAGTLAARNYCAVARGWQLQPAESAVGTPSTGPRFAQQ